MAEPSPWQRPETGTTPPLPAAPVSPMPIDPHPAGSPPDGGNRSSQRPTHPSGAVGPRNDGLGFGDPVPAEDERLDRRTRWIAAGVGAALVAVLIVVLGWAGVGPASRLHADSGVRACKDVATGDTAGGTRSNAGDVTMSQDDYRRIRGQFQGSRFADLRGSGTHFVDLVWQIGRMLRAGGDPLTSAIAYGGEVFSAYSDLSGACANHGVTLPPLGGD